MFGKRKDDLILIGTLWKQPNLGSEYLPGEILLGGWTLDGGILNRDNEKQFLFTNAERGLKVVIPPTGTLVQVTRGRFGTKEPRFLPEKVDPNTWQQVGETVTVDLTKSIIGDCEKDEWRNGIHRSSGAEPASFLTARRGRSNKKEMITP